MKKFILILTIFAGLILAPIDGQAVLIQPGDMVRLDFDLSGESPPPPYISVSVLLEFGLAGSTTIPREGNLFDVGEGFTRSFFDEDRSLLYQDVFSNPFGFSVDNFSMTPILSSSLTTSVGYVLLTDIVGTFDLIEDDVWIGGWRTSSPSDATDLVQASVTVTQTPVPEPSTLLLLGSGLVGLVGFRRKRQ